ncbi:MAG: hypothetical protein LQ347_001183 [Umbilicaria vellea]|nr:MAG: hypothetical protein LQ347_001183 [Umbilicaria vellea]
MRLTTFLRLLLALLPVITAALLKPAAAARTGTPAQPLTTPSPAAWETTKTFKSRRGIIRDLAGDVSSVLTGLRLGVPRFFHRFPSADAVKSSLGLNENQIAALPTQVLNIPGYGNWTDQGWNLRFHGNVYKQPNISESKLDVLVNIFLIGTSVQALPPSQASQARNLTAEIFILQQGNQNVTFSIAPTAGSSGNQIIKLPTPTTPEGDFDSFLPISNNGFEAGNDTNQVQQLSVSVQGAPISNATAYLVPPKGLTIISDIDDILRITKIYEPVEGLLNTFARPFKPWLNMPSIYANWSAHIPNFHFHYLTTTPEQITRSYVDFIYNTYPGGSFDTRPLNFSDVSATLRIRKFLLKKAFQTYPDRKFILIADTSNSDVMRNYPAMVRKFPGQVQCIFLRNTSATDSGDKFPYDTSGFKGLDQKMYMFFRVPDDLTNLDIVNGQCYNASVPQNLTFSYQGLPFGINKASTKKGAAG